MYERGIPKEEIIKLKVFCFRHNGYWFHFNLWIKLTVYQNRKYLKTA